MNHIFKSKWSASKGAYVAVSELTKGKTKSSKSVSTVAVLSLVGALVSGAASYAQTTINIDFSEHFYNPATQTAGPNKWGDNAGKGPAHASGEGHVVKLTGSLDNLKQNSLKTNQTYSFRIANDRAALASRLENWEDKKKYIDPGNPDSLVLNFGAKGQATSFDDTITGSKGSISTYATSDLVATYAGTKDYS